MEYGKSRLVRVFISSTFRDFIEERDLLVKKVFPELRRRCRERFVELIEIDLRWGITEEQSKNGETLLICLEEIDRCRPSAPVFFVGMLGERYGWIPKSDFYSDDVLKNPNFQWVREHVGGKSVTELEILHGILRNPNLRKAMKDKAYFYFRNNGYEIRHWKSISAYHKEIGQMVEPSDFNNSKSNHSLDDDERQYSLKQRIRDASLAWEPTDYETPVDMAERVCEDLWKAIDRIFPASEVPDAFQRESLEHTAYRDSRTRAYVQRPGLFESLDAHANGEGENCRIITGESGSGKTALISAWLKRHHESVVFFHFTGATPSSARAESILHRLLYALRERGAVHLTSQIPRDPARMASILPEWLENLSSQGGGVILLDALNQLTTSKDRSLWWLPTSWPENIRIVLSSLPGEVWREFENRSWTTSQHLIEIPPLVPSERHAIIDNYLCMFAHKLAPTLKERLACASQSSNPLFIRATLEELRLRSSHETLESNLESMLNCKDLPALFVHILKNLERDFTPKESKGVRSDLVHFALGLMGAARRGLTEAELLQLLSIAEKPSTNPVPQHYWSPIFLALEESLVSRDGQLSFFHDHLRQAVLREYLDEKDEKISAYRRLGETVTRWNEEDYFSPTLRNYGFEYGIQHLLALDEIGVDGSLREARDLLLNRSYREAASRRLRSLESVREDIFQTSRRLAASEPHRLTDFARLSSMVLTEPNRLAKYLRDLLDDLASEGQWEEVMGLAGAADSPPARLILALRAQLHAGREPPPEEFRKLVKRWTDESSGEEWGELAELVSNMLTRS